MSTLSDSSRSVFKSLSAFMLLLQIQWKDRRATSSFAIGMTLQTAVLTWAILNKDSQPGELVTLAVRSAFVTTVTISLFASMSNVVNEFHSGTIEYIMLGKKSFFWLLFVRALTTAAVCSSAVIIFFVAAGLRETQLPIHRIVVPALGVILCNAVICFQSSFVVNSFSQPFNAIPWVKYAHLIIGLNFINLPGLSSLAQVFPSYWVQQTGYTEFSLLECALGFLFTSLLTTAVALLMGYRNMQGKIEAKLLSGRVGT